MQNALYQAGYSRNLGVISQKLVKGYFSFHWMYRVWATLAWWIGEGNDTLLQYSCLENPMGGGAWWAAVHGVTKSQTQLTDFTFTFHFHALEKEMATHSSVLAWRIPGMAEPGGLLSVGSHRVGHDWSNLAAAAAACWINLLLHGLFCFFVLFCFLQGLRKLCFIPDLVWFFKNYDKIYHFECTVRWYWIHSHWTLLCSQNTTVHLQNFLIWNWNYIKLNYMYLLNGSSPFESPSAPGHCYSTSCLSEFDCFR